MGINNAEHIVGTFAAPPGEQSSIGPEANSAAIGWCQQNGGEFRNRQCPHIPKGSPGSNGPFVRLDSGFLDSGGFFTTIQPLISAVFSSATGINDLGQIIGNYFDGTQSVGFLGAAGNFTAFNPPNQNPNCAGCQYLATILTGINDAGMIVGSGQGFGGFLYNAGTFIPLSMTPTGINNIGQVVGYSSYSSHPGQYATQMFLYNSGVYSVIDTSSLGANVYPAAINNSNEIVGYFSDANGVSHGFVESGGSFTIVDYPSVGTGQATFINGVNDAGQIVGSYTDANGVEHGFLGTPNTSSAGAVLAITKSHAGIFAQGEQNATYTVTVSNAPNAGTTSAAVTVTEILPAGLTLGSMTGVGWSCSTNTCTRADALAAGASYPTIAVTVNVAASAASPQVNEVSVSGGGSASASASDPTIISIACSIGLGRTFVSLPATGTSTVEICPNNSGQPNCGVAPEAPQSFSVIPSANCNWTATSSNPGVLQITLGGSGSGTGMVGYTLLNNTHASPQSYTITVSSGVISAPLSVTEAGSGNSQVYREVYALYEQLLGRDPDPAGLAFWTGAGGAGLGQMADSFLTSPEAFNSDFAVMAVYQAATGHPPTYTQFTAAVSAIREGTLTVAGLFNLLIGSGYSAATLYQNILNRQPTAADSSCTSMPLSSCFQTIIGYPSNTSPVGAADIEFQSTGIYHAVDHTNSLYVQMIYYVTLGRDPDPAGLAFWVEVANTGGPGLLFQANAGFGIRIQILGPGTPNQGFIGSQEFQSLFAN